MHVMDENAQMSRGSLRKNIIIWVKFFELHLTYTCARGQCKTFKWCIYGQISLSKISKLCCEQKMEIQKVGKRRSVADVLTKQLTDNVAVSNPLFVSLARLRSRV